MKATAAEQQLAGSAPRPSAESINDAHDLRVDDLQADAAEHEDRQQNKPSPLRADIAG